MKAIVLFKVILLIAFLFLSALGYGSESFSQPSSIFSINLDLEAKPITGSHLITKVSIFIPGESIHIYYQENIFTDNNDDIQLDLSDFTQDKNNNYHILIEIPGYLDEKISNHNLIDDIADTVSLDIGDLDNNNYIDEDDWIIMSNQWQNTDSDADLNEDNLVNTLDFSWLNKNWHLSGAAPPQPAPSQTPTPEPFTGSVPYQKQAAEYEDTIAFIYVSGYTYLYVNRSGTVSTYKLSEVPAWQPSYAQLTSQNDVWVACGLPLKMAHYDISGDTALLSSSETIGDSYSRVAGFIRLQDGRLLIAGHQQKRVYDEDNNVAVDTWLKLYDNDVWNTTTTRLSPCNYATHETVVQHQDGSIWHFVITDGSHTIRLVYGILVPEGIEIDYAEKFITKWDYPDFPKSPYPPEGELPHLSAVVYNDSIRLTYQNEHSYMFSTDPFCKGAYMYLVDIKPDFSYSLVFEAQQYTERMNTILSGADWIAYGQVDGVELTWNDLYSCRNGTEFTYLGELVGGIPNNAGINICSSSKWIIAQMSDSKIHFFNIDDL